MQAGQTSPGFGQPLPPRPEWLKTQPAEPILDPDLPIVDTHHHFWQRPGNRYFLEEILGDIGSGHNIVATVFIESQAGYRTTGPEALRPVGETGFVAEIGQAADAGSGARNHIARGIVGFADLSLGDAVRPVLEAHIEAGAGRFRGVRYATAWDASDAIRNSHAASGPHTLLRPEVLAGLKTLASMDLVFDAMVFHPQLDDIAGVARAIPELSIVLGHVGGPLGYGPYQGKRDEVYAAWKTSMASLAQLPNVTVKLGGVLSRLAAFDYIAMPTAPDSAELAAHWRPYMDVCIELFGASRCMFESNFPVEKMGTGYATLWNAFKRIAQGASDTEKQCLFNGTGRRTYRLE